MKGSPFLFPEPSSRRLAGLQPEGAAEPQSRTQSTSYAEAHGLPLPHGEKLGDLLEVFKRKLGVIPSAAHHRKPWRSS